MQEFERVEDKPDTQNNEFDRVEGREFNSGQMQQPMTEAREHQHSEPVIAKKFLAENNSIMRYRHESWFMPLVGMGGVLLVLVLAAIFL